MHLWLQEVVWNVGDIRCGECEADETEGDEGKEERFQCELHHFEGLMVGLIGMDLS